MKNVLIIPSANLLISATAGQIDRQTDRQTGRLAGRQADR